MRRVFIISNCNFPRGGALSNYIQYLILAIREASYDTVLLTDINKEYAGERQSIPKSFGTIVPIKISQNRIVKHVQYKYGFASARIKKMKELHISSEDVVIVFGQNNYFYEKLLLFKEKIGFKIIGGMLELYAREDFDSGREYTKYKKLIEKIVPQFDAVLPISTFIEQFYSKRDVKTFLLPIMADSSEFKIEPKNLDKYRFIIPANGRMKDNLSAMLKAFALLELDELNRVELHLCGVKEQKVNEVLNEDERIRLERILVIHKWMKYDELISIYQQMNFLVLARDTNQMTLANFPSKIPETMAFGIVPIASKVGDYTKYYLEDSVNSIFIYGCTVQNVLESIRRALKLSEEEYFKLSKSAVKCVETRFDYHVWSGTVKKMIDQI